MSASGTMWVLVAGFFLVAGCVVCVITDRDSSDADSDILPPKRDRDDYSDRSFSTVELPPVRVYTHTAPARPLSVEQAHTITQQHRYCDAEECPRKRAAIRVLIEAGRMRLP
ncbi:hypothetical protein KO481_16570 [Nocardia sp. NEAU-G5]|uniref:DUF732 domain-containing protein n=1 Tax=Nocardia albiluteola TaxID=2842303 RepID=A0ABS6B078_9NOCA|nr:hypothetical protein [Nocardia albiluteola]MBU3063136.1 hypothetical protein [Nocardia albiluteola]